MASDTEVEAITLGVMPGAEFHRLWGADEAPTFPDDGSPRLSPTYFPPLGGFRFGLFTVPPQSVRLPEGLDMAAAFMEVEEKLPGLASCWERATPGMHTTDNVDFEYVLSGKCGWSWTTARRYTSGLGTRSYRTGPGTHGATGDRSPAVWCYASLEPSADDGGAAFPQWVAETSSRQYIGGKPNWEVVI